MDEQDLYRVLSRAQLADRPATSWLIEDFIQDNGFTVLYGPPAVGKTFFGLDMSLSVASGVHWHGRPVMVPGDVAYLSPEGFMGLHVRIAGWEKVHGRGVPNVSFLYQAPDLRTPMDRKRLLESLRANLPRRPKLIVVDTLARHFGDGNENAPQDMNAFVKTVDSLRQEFSCAVLALHHPAKNSQQERGHTSLRGAADTMVAMLSSRQGEFTVHCTKQKEKEPFESMLFRLRSVDVRHAGRTFQTRVIEPLARSRGSAKSTGDGLDESKKKVLRAFRDDPNAVIRAKDLKEKSGLKHATFYRALSDLTRDALLEGGRGGYRLTEKGIEALNSIS